MDLSRLIDSLSLPTAYPFPVETVEVRQTHISAVFLVGPFVYKIKKPVNPGFLDFTTLEKRLHYCREEVRLNRRLAPQVYLDVVPVARTPVGVRVETEGEIIEWAVKMQRLPESATLLDRLRRDELGVDLVCRFARRLAFFHRDADANERIGSFGRFEIVARNLRDVFAKVATQSEAVVNSAVAARISSLFEDALARLEPVINTRAARGKPRDCHGDLHLDHIYYFPDRQPPADLAIIDCIEFSEHLRFIDPVADMAFAAMDLTFHGRGDLARSFDEAYFQSSGEEDGKTLLPLYTAYRAAVRGMVDGLLLTEAEVPQAERERAFARARAHWMLALTMLETPDRKPCLLLVGGLPGTGKSTISKLIAERSGFSVVRSDVVRKELANLPPDEPTPLALRGLIYTPEWTERTYAECLHQARQIVLQGKRVLVDATFREEHRRRTFLEAAVRWGVPGLLLLCRADPSTVKERLEQRRGDASDADWSVYGNVAATWEQPSPATRRNCRDIETAGEPDKALDAAIAFLREFGLRA